MNHLFGVATPVGPGMRVEDSLPNVSRVNFLVNKNLVQVYQGNGNSVREFDLSNPVYVLFTIENGNYSIYIGAV